MHTSILYSPLTSTDDDIGDIRYDEKRTQNEIINNCRYNDRNFIHARLDSTKSLMVHGTSGDLAYNSLDGTSTNGVQLTPRNAYPMMLELITEALVGSSQTSTVYDNKNDSYPQPNNERSTVPTLNSILQQVEKQDGTKLDEKQIMTYRSICATFLLGLIQDGLDDKTLLGQYFTAVAAKSELTNSTKNLVALMETKLMAIGGRHQLIMFLTGPAGAGKTTAVKIAEKFCFQFCRAVSIIWRDNTFLFTAYTGSAASAFGGLTICTAAFLNKGNEISDDEKQTWLGVRIVVIDEISFMKAKEIEKLNKNLQLIGDSSKPYGGFSIIFAGDFRQLEPVGAKDADLLFSRASGCGFENKLNAVIFLENKHRFKQDPRYGDMLRRMWEGDLPREDREWINERHGLKLPKSNEFRDLDVVYATPTNRERNAITAGNFRDHVQKTCPSFNTPDDILPPDHTIIIEADILSSATKKQAKYNQRIAGSMRHRILTTCGDANCSSGTRRIDPALCLYTGAHLICTTDNKNLRDKVPFGNGTLCRLTGVKLKPGKLRQMKNYYDRKVWTICASDVEYIECEHYPRPPHINALHNNIKSKISDLNRVNDKLNQTKPSSPKIKHLKKKQQQLNHDIEQIKSNLIRETKHHTFQLTPNTLTTKVSVLAHPLATTPTEMTCKMTQFPVNCNDATTGHKLQGMSKDIVIITSWPGGFFKNWEYVVLSRVRTHDGLYLFRKISMDKDFSPSLELSLFFKRTRSKEEAFIQENKYFREKLKTMLEKSKQNDIL